MDYLNEAFGSFVPRLDKDAAVKFALNAVLMDARIDELVDLLTEGNDIGGVRGEPGWILERRDEGEAGNMPGYADWPPTARFRAFVNPDAYELAHPEFFMDRAAFHRYVSAAMHVYSKANPTRIAHVAKVLRKTGISL